jgi:hypothetical protein
MTEQEIEDFYQRELEASGIKPGDIFYDAFDLKKWEVIKYAFMSGIYFYIACFESRELRLEKRVSLLENSKYNEYFRKLEDAKRQKLLCLQVQNIMMEE